MKVLRIIGSADPRFGGPIEGVIRSSEVMARHGHVNEIVCLDDPSDKWLTEFPLPVHAMGRVARRYRYSPRLAPWVSSHIGEYDAAIVHGLWNYSSVGAWRALARSKTPYFVFPHGMLDPWFARAQPVKGLAKRLYWNLFESNVLNDAACVLFTSEEERRQAQTAFPGDYRTRVVSYGAVDAPLQTEGVSLADVVPGLNGRPYLLFLGRIHPKKGCDLLIKALASVASAHPGLDLVMAGPDDIGWRPKLQELAAGLGVADRIHWPGMLVGSAKWVAFAAAEAFVLPSHQENFGIAVAEALACSTPALVTDKVNIWGDIVRAGGGMVAEDNAAGIADMLRRFLALDAGSLTEMRKNARLCYLRSFDVESAARDLTNVLESFEPAR